MTPYTGVLGDRALSDVTLCLDGVIEGHLPTYQAAADALETFADQARTRPWSTGTEAFGALQHGDQAGDAIAEDAARALYEAAFGPPFTTDFAVTYRLFYGIAWLAVFTWKGTVVDLCFNALDTWRVSIVDRCDSVPFIHTADASLIRQRLDQALDRLLVQD